MIFTPQKQTTKHQSACQNPRRIFPLSRYSVSQLNADGDVQRHCTQMAPACSTTTAAAMERGSRDQIQHEEARHSIARNDSRRVCHPPPHRHDPPPAQGRTETHREPGLAGALGRSGRGAPKSGAPGWGAGRCKISGALRFKTISAVVGVKPVISSSADSRLRH